MIAKFTIEELISKVRELALNNPEFLYRKPLNSQKCSYTTGADGKGCIFGQAMVALQPDIEDFLRYRDNQPIEMILSILAIGDDNDKEWCGTVQHKQDWPKMWGECVERV